MNTAISATTLCSYTGPEHAWSIPVQSTKPPEIFFRNIAGCCNLIDTTYLPRDEDRLAFLNLLFQQFDKNNNTITSFNRKIAHPKILTGLENTAVKLKTDFFSIFENPIKGIQKYINCSDAINLVDKTEKHSNTGAIVGGVFGGLFGLGLIGLAIAHLKGHSNSHSASNSYVRI